MITIVDKIDKKINEKGEELLIIHFKYGEKDRFSYLTEKSVKYWFDKGVKEIKIGGKINVFEVPDTKFYKIVKFL